MKNLIPVIIVVCLTFFTGYIMTTGEMELEKKDDKATEQKKDAKTAKEKQDTEMKINSQEDLDKIINSKKDEKTKMNAYNQAVEKKILPRSNNYQDAADAYKESVKIKDSKSK